MMVTMTTVGYGDGFPLTHLGRFITFIGCILGTLLVSLMVVSLTNTSELSIGELRVYNEMIKLDVKANTQKTASHFILAILQAHVLNKKMERSNEKEASNLIMQKFGLLSRMKRHVKDFKKQYKKYDSYSSSAEDSIVKLNANGLEKLEEVYRNFGKAKKIERKCKRIIVMQKKIVDMTDNMVIFQNCINNFIVNFNSTYQEEETN